MKFKRIEPGKDYVEDIIKAPQIIETWVKMQTAVDTRPNLERARIQDIYMALVEYALPEKTTIVYKKKWSRGKMKTKGSRVQMPKWMYDEIRSIQEGLKQGTYFKEGRHTVDFFNVFLCLMEVGFAKATKPKPKPDK